MATGKTPESAPEELDESVLESVDGGAGLVYDGVKWGYGAKSDGNDFMRDGTSNTIRKKTTGED